VTPPSDSEGPAATLELGTVADVEELRELWLELHHHHRAIAPSLPLLDDDELSWRQRRAQYLGRLRAGNGFLALARRETAVLGYAFVFIEDGPDDTYPLGEHYAELYTLVIAGHARGHGLGSRLLDFVDHELARRNVHDLMVSVMSGNAGAVRLYERRGLKHAEIVMYRLGGSVSP
jgi:ribosomal protein S18 acetylase RimI-like enzyme